VSGSFLIQNGMKQGDILLPLFLVLLLEYTIRKVRDHEEKLELNGTHEIPGLC